MGDRGGWVKFRREWLNDPAINGDADRLAVFMYLLCNAAIAPTPAMFGGKPIILQPGQLTAGRRQIAEATGVQEFKVMRTAKRLETAHLIAQQASNKNSLFSILCGDFSSNSAQQNEQQLHSNCTHLENKELRNISSSDLPDGSTDKPPQRKRFAPPTLDEVQKYCQERGNTVDAEQFCAFYESKGWRVGNQPMKSWQAAVLTWERRERKDREEQKAEGTSAYEHEL